MPWSHRYKQVHDLHRPCSPCVDPRSEPRPTQDPSSPRSEARAGVSGGRGPRLGSSSLSPPCEHTPAPAPALPRGRPSREGARGGLRFDGDRQQECRDRRRICRWERQVRQVHLGKLFLSVGPLVPLGKDTSSRACVSTLNKSAP